MALTNELSAVQINQIERRIVEAEKTRGVVTLDPKIARELLELAIARMESQNRSKGW